MEIKEFLCFYEKKDEIWRGDSYIPSIVTFERVSVLPLNYILSIITFLLFLFWWGSRSYHVFIKPNKKNTIRESEENETKALVFFFKQGLVLNLAFMSI